MPTPKKDGKYLNIYMDRQLFEQLQQFCTENGVTKTFAVEKVPFLYTCSSKVDCNLHE